MILMLFHEYPEKTKPNLAVEEWLAGGCVEAQEWDSLQRS
jgi:hypothetical protein